MSGNDDDKELRAAIAAVHATMAPEERANPFGDGNPSHGGVFQKTACGGDTHGGRWEKWNLPLEAADRLFEVDLADD